MLELSQVIYGVRDLDAATQRMQALGLAVLDGGRHPGLGTANRIIPLGSTYLELLGVVDETEARDNDYGERYCARSLMVTASFAGRCARTTSMP